MLKSYSPKEGVENLGITFPNIQTGETVNVETWPFETSDREEMAFLDDHPLIEGAEVEEVDPAKPLKAMTKAELVAVAPDYGVEPGEMNKADLLSALQDEQAERAANHESEAPEEDA